MIETEFHILSDRREGLLIEIGQTVVDSGFILVSQRLGKHEDGALLRLTLRGPDSKLPALEEKLSSHPRVLSYESFRQDAPQAPAASDTSTSVSAHPETLAPAVHQVEAVLPHIAKDYPKIFSRLKGLKLALSEPAQAPTLRYTGHRVGVWVYKRDFALGGKLGFNEAIRQIAVPALKQMLPARFNNGHLEIDDNPLCPAGSGARNGHFFCGFLEGLLGEACQNHHISAQEQSCCSDGAHRCVFEVTSN